MFHGCALRGVPIIFFCFVFIVLVLILLCYAIFVAIQNKNKHLGFKKIIKVVFYDLLDAGLDIGLFIFVGLFILMMMITIPISYSKKHAIKEAEYYCKKYTTLQEEINRTDENKQNLSEELKYYDEIFTNKKIKECEEMKKKLDYWCEKINK